VKEKEREREEILRELHASRSEFVRGATDLRRSFNIPHQIRRSIANYSLWALGGVTVIGFLLAFRKPKIVYVPQPETSSPSKDPGGLGKSMGLLAGALAIVKWLLPVIRPLLVSYASRKASDYVRRN